jgi:hypothetical protein
MASEPCYSTDAVDMPQPQRPGLISEHGQPSDGLADRGDPVQNFRGDGAGGLIS